MTVNPPYIAPINPFLYPGLVRSIPGVMPFTQRSGATFLNSLEDIIHYLRGPLAAQIDAINSADNNVQSSLATALADQTATVEAQLATVLEQIVAGENVNLNDASVLAAIQSVGSVTSKYLGAGLRIQGTGIDPTGVADSTTAIQTFLNGVADGATVVVPEGAIFTISTGIDITKRIRLTGGGELRWIGAEDAMLRVKTDNVHLDGIYLSNPNGASVSAIYIYANATRVTNSRIVGFRDGICVAATGEYYNNVIEGNEVLDIIGSGNGFSANDWGSGESNGDGIVSWGAGTVIVGNRVTAKSGKDARIGIHVEALPDRYGTNGGDFPDSVSVISGNVVSGPFRRSITTEGVHETAITGNVCIGFTFWGINVVGYNRNVVVANNVIKKTGQHAAAPGIIHTGILLYCIQYAQDNINVTNNAIYVAPGAYMDNGITVDTDPSVATLGIQHSRISGNSITDDANILGDGIHVSPGSDSLEITDNRVYRFGVAGVRVAQGTRTDVSRNHLYGRGTASGVIGVSLEGGANEAVVDGNIIRDAETGIRAYFRGETLAVRGNTIRNTTYGVDLYGAATGLIALLVNNLLNNVGTPLFNAPTGVVLA